MTTWTIAQYTNVLYGEWWTESHSQLVLGYGGGSSQVTSDPIVIAAAEAEVINGFIIRPFKKYEFWNWDDVNNVWANDPDKYPPAFRIAMSAHRRSKSEAVIGYNGVYVTNTKEEMGIVQGLIEFLKTKGLDVTINWKGAPVNAFKNVEWLPGNMESFGAPIPNPEYDPNHADAQNRWKEAKLEDLSGIILLGTEKEQASFNAEKYVMDIHAVTPYPSIEAAVMDFDIKFDELTGV